MTHRRPTTPTAPPSSGTLATELERGDRTCVDIVLGVAMGGIDLPPFLDDPTVRWLWSAEVLIHPDWGVVSLAPDHRAIITSAAALCVSTAETLLHIPTGDRSDRVTVSRETWMAIDRDTRTAMTTLRPGSDAYAALDTVTELATDGLAELAGRDYTGVEAMTAILSALTNRHRCAARPLLLAALAYRPDPIARACRCAHRPRAAS